MKPFWDHPQDDDDDDVMLQQLKLELLYVQWGKIATKKVK